MENLASFVIVTVFLGGAMEAVRRIWDRISNRRYRDWTLTVIPENDTRREYSNRLLWDEVRKFEKSPFENRKFIQSVCTSENVRIKAGEISVDDPNGWVFRDDKSKTYRFNFKIIPPGVRK